MATKFSSLSTGTAADGQFLAGYDPTDTTMAGTGTNKRYNLTGIKSYIQSGLLANVSDDTTPQAGGHYDINGKAMCFVATNNTGSAIAIGTPVAYNAASGDVIEADANVAASMPCRGITTEELTASGGTGLVAVWGIVGGLNTSGYTALDALYVSDTVGTLTNSAPTSNAQEVARVWSVHASTGEIFVNCLRQNIDLSILTNSTAIAGTDLMLFSDGSDNDNIKARSLSNAITDLSITTDSNTQTLTNKTLTTPIISQISNTGTLTLPTSTDTLVGRATTDTLTNKTLTAPIISTISNTGTLTLPTSTDTLVGRDTTDTLTNKTLTSPVISAISNTGTLTLPTSTDTLVGRATTDTLTNKTLTTPVISQISNTGTLTLPTSTDTLVGRATTDTLTNKTLTTPVIASISNSGTVTVPSGTDTLVARTSTDTMTNKTLTAPVINGTVTTTGLTLPAYTMNGNVDVGGNAIVSSSNGDIDITPNGTGKTVITNIDAPLDINAQTGTTYTGVLADSGKLITMSNASANTFTIPANASVAYPVGTQIHIEQLGAGATTVAITTDTLNVNANLTAVLNGQYAVATAVKNTSTTWTLFGNLVAA